MLSEENKRVLAQTEIERNENREAVGMIIDCVRFLGKQGLAFRGHEETASATNRGNFLELVHFLATYNLSLKKWLDSHPGNASYLSPDIQNQIISVLFETVINEIKTEVTSSACYGIEADEVSDTTGKEYVSIIIRYIVGYEVMERLVGLVRVEDMSGKGLSSILKQRLQRLGLELTNIVGQCYDGASNMSGQYRGLQTEIKKDAGDKDTHCYNHILALVLQQSASKIPLVVEVFTWLNTAYKFLKHYKVLVEYDKVLKERQLQGQYKMQSLSVTRWYARSKNLDITVNGHAVLVDICEKVINEPKVFDAELRLTAESLHQKLLNRDFCLALLVMKDTFSKCNAASEYLQTSSIDFLAAIEAVNNLRAILSSTRTDEAYADYEQKVVDLLRNVTCAETSDVNEPATPEPAHKRARKMPAKLCDGQSLLPDFIAFRTSTFTVRSASDAVNTAPDLKVSFYFVLIDTLLTALDDRFGKSTCEILKWMTALSPKCWDEKNKMNIEQLCHKYGIAEEAVVQYALFARNEGRKSCANIRELLKYMWDTDLHNVYPDLFQLVKVCATIPITATECERTHSKVALVKSAVRSSMGDARLEHLVTLNVEQDIATKLGLMSLVDAFKLAGPDGSRRIKL